MTQLNQYVERVVEGQIVKIPVSQPHEHRNPPLHSLNQAYKQAAADRHEDVDAVVKAGIGAMKGAAANRLGRRVQKPLRIPPGK